MRKFVLPTLAAAMLAAPMAGATEIRRFAHQCAVDFHRNNGWPEPFMWPDRAAVCAPFGVMIHNGWRMQNTLASHHFREGTSELTEAGKLKVLWIMNEAPAQHRTIFIERSEAPELTQGRVRTVQNIAASLAVDGMVPAVMETGIAPRGWPADQIDVTTRRFYDTTPDPRLPERSASGTTGGN